MSNLDVDPSALLARSTTFRAAADEQMQAGTHDQSQTESDIAAFGEINSALHNSWRAVRARQAQSWTGLGREHDEHADKLVTVSRGYEGQDDTNAQMLHAGEGVGLPGVPPVPRPGNPAVADRLFPAPSPGTEAEWAPSAGDADHPPRAGYGATLPDAPRPNGRG